MFSAARIATTTRHHFTEQVDARTSQKEMLVSAPKRVTGFVNSERAPLDHTSIATNCATNGPTNQRRTARSIQPCGQVPSTGVAQAGGPNLNPGRAQQSWPEVQQESPQHWSALEQFTLQPTKEH